MDKIKYVVPASAVAVKETTELVVAAAATVAAGYKVAEDGKLTVGDIVHFIPLVDVWQKAIADLDVMGELRTASNADMATIPAVIASQMGTVPADDRKDITDLMVGVLAGIRIVGRTAYERGLLEGLAQAKARAKE